jgi:hypothetical protein
MLPLPAQPVSAEPVVGTPSTITRAEASPTPSHHIEPTPVRAVPVGQSGTVNEPWTWPADLSSPELVGPAQSILAVPVPPEAAAGAIEIRNERARPEVADAGIEVRNERVPDDSTEEDKDVSSVAQRPQAEESAGAVGVQAPHVEPAGDSTAPAEPSIQFPEDGSVLPGGPLNILGVAPGAARVEIFDWLHPIGQARVEEDGSWALRVDRFEDGTHMLTARSADGAGALSSPSRPSVVTLGDSAAAAASRARRRRRMFLALGVILVILVVVVVAAFLGLRHGS